MASCPRRKLIPMVIVPSLILGGVTSGADPLPVLIPRSQQIQMVASNTQRHFSISIIAPAEPPASSKGYPTVYVLDANSTFLLAAGAWSLQATAGNGLEPALVVAIGYDADEPSLRRFRYFDLTPPADAEVLRNLNDSSLTEFGGADAFLNFIETDLKPYIRSHFATDSDRQALVGHSLGGLLVLYTLFTNPELFSAYIAGSPSIWWNRGMMFEYAYRTRNTKSVTALPKRVLIAIGSQESQTMINDAFKMADALRKNMDEKYKICFLNFQDEDHMSMIPVLINRSVRFFLSSSPC